jgi:DNA-3-methyladenine glycosylase
VFSLSPIRRPRFLRRAELPVDTVALARFLIGKLLVHDLPEGRVVGRIVETEAYVHDDPSSHAYRGLATRNASMFLERGHAYVYFIYGSAYCVNVSGETPGVGAAALVRALEPIEGLDIMKRRRGTDRVRDLARGPGRLTQATGITREHDGLDLCGRASALRLAAGGQAPAAIERSVRIGISKEADRLLRFHECGNPFVSGSKRLNGLKFL